MTIPLFSRIFCGRRGGIFLGGTADYHPRGRGTAEEGRLYGLPVLRGSVDPSGFWGERRLTRAGRSLRRGGALRVLVPRDFARWPLLERLGLRPVETEGFVRAQSAPLALAALERRGVAPDRATVALRGRRADRDMARTAAELCRRVRRLVVDAPSGGEELAVWLRWEFGLPILPPGRSATPPCAFRRAVPAGRRGRWSCTAPGPVWPV
ncbi:hypothetical protein N510_002941 [Firmicutes bacterium ASF500]|nr:hypothetical protein N510_002941 [Firmicutes bacterium ASF500]